MEQETHVVTLTVEFCDGRAPSAFSCELYRGNEMECRHLAAMIPGCGHDYRVLAASAVQCDTIADWERFVGSVPPGFMP